MKEWGEKTSFDVERLEREIFSLQEQQSQIAENVGIKDQQLGKLNANY